MVRMPPEYIAAPKAFAFQSSVPLAEYVRGMVDDHILQRGAAFRERGAALRALVRAGKAWVITYHECVALAAGLSHLVIRNYEPPREPLYTATASQAPVMDLFSLQGWRIADLSRQAPEAVAVQTRRRNVRGVGFEPTKAYATG